MTTALQVLGRVPALRRTLGASPHLGSDAWHIVARNRRTGQQLYARGHAQSVTTGRLTALAATRVVQPGLTGPTTMADIATLDDLESAGATTG